MAYLEVPRGTVLKGTVTARDGRRLQVAAEGRTVFLEPWQAAGYAVGDAIRIQYVTKRYGMRTRGEWQAF